MHQCPYKKFKVMGLDNDDEGEDCLLDVNVEELEVDGEILVMKLEGIDVEIGGKP